MATFADLPPEVLELVLTHLDPSQAQLARLALTSRCLTGPSQYLLFANATITNLNQFDLLLDVLQPPRTGKRPTLEAEDWPSQDEDLDHSSAWAKAVGTRRLKIECSNFGEKGWGLRIGKLLQLAVNVRALELRGLDDFRMKALQGRGGARTLSIVSTTFKNHALPSSATLPTFLRSIDHLTLANLGQPHPNTHSQHIIQHCAHNLTYLALSSLRDLGTSELLHPLFASLRPESAPNLCQIRFGSFDARQTEIIAQSECLPRLTQVQRIGWTFPLPTVDLLEATPSGARTLVLRPRASPGKRRDERMQAVEDEARVVSAVIAALSKGVFRSAGKSVTEIRWGGEFGACERLRAAAGEQIAVHLVRDK